jgi:nitroreductase
MPRAHSVRTSVYTLLCVSDRLTDRRRTGGGRVRAPSACAALDSFMNASVDAGIAMMAFIASAESVGLGCCPISAVREHLHELCPAFDIPDSVFPVAGLCLGWPTDPDPRRITVRKRYSFCAVFK